MADFDLIKGKMPRLKPRSKKTYKQGDEVGKHGWTVLGRSGDKWAMLCPRCANIVVGIALNIAEQPGCNECAERGSRVEDVTTGDVYRTALQAAKANGINPSSLTRSLRIGKPDPKIGHQWQYTTKSVTVEFEEEETVTIPRSRYEELLRLAGEE